MSGLTWYFARQYRHGTILSTQDLQQMGYEQAVDDVGNRVLRHALSGIYVWLYALDLTNPTAMETEFIVMFHYTSEQDFRTIVDTANNLTEIRTKLGSGVYTTRRDPAVFGTRNAVVYNNYFTRSVNSDTFPDELSMRSQFVTHCIPLIVAQEDCTIVPTHESQNTSGLDEIGAPLNQFKALKWHLSEQAGHLLHELTVLLEEGQDLHMVKGDADAMVNFQSNIVALLRKRVCHLMTLGFEHPTTLDEMLHLATRLRICGNLESAERLQRQVLGVASLNLGPGHPSTLASKSNLATTLSLRGDLEGAAKLRREVMDAEVCAPGSELQHPSAHMSTSNFTSTFFERGDLSSAESLQHGLLDVENHDVGAESKSASSSAPAVEDRTKLQETEKLQREILDTAISTLGPDHPSTLMSRKRLTRTLLQIGDREGAARLQWEASNTDISTLGFSDTEISPDLASTLRELEEELLDSDAFNAKIRMCRSESDMVAALSEHGDSKSFDKLGWEVLDSAICSLGHDHPSTIVIKNNLAATLLHRGNLKVALQLQWEIFDSELRTLGPEHPRTLTSKSSLAAMLAQCGDSDGAEELNRRFLDAEIRALSPDLATLWEKGDAKAPKSLAGKIHLATTLFNNGDLEGAAKLQQEVLDADLRNLGPEHPSTLMDKRRLATTLLQCGELERAEKLKREVLDAEISALGPDFAEGADNLEQEVLEIATRSLGAEHPSTTVIKSPWATMSQRRDMERAEDFSDADIRALALEQPRRRSKTGTGLWELGDLQSANKLEQELLGIAIHSLGPEHPSTSAIYSHLATSLSKRGDMKRSGDLPRDFLATEMRTVAPEHPMTVHRGSSASWEQGALKDADKLEREVLDIAIRSLGPEHPTTLVINSRLATTLPKRREPEGAEELHQTVPDADIRTLAPKHPITLRSKSNVAYALWEIGDLEGASKLEREVLDIAIRSLGPEHPCTLVIYSHLAATLSPRGYLEEALEHRKTSKGSVAATFSRRSSLDGTEGSEKLEREVDAQIRALWSTHQSKLGCTSTYAEIRALWSAHQSTLSSKSNFATAIWELEREVLTIALRNPGP